MSQDTLDLECKVHIVKVLNELKLKHKIYLEYVLSKDLVLKDK